MERVLAWESDHDLLIGILCAQLELLFTYSAILLEQGCYIRRGRK